MTRTRAAQVVSLGCAPHISCVIFMRSCCVFDSLRLLHFPLLAVYLLSYRPVFPPGHQLHLPRCGGKNICALQLMRTLAPLPSTTLSQCVARALEYERAFLREVLDTAPTYLCQPSCDPPRLVHPQMLEHTMPLKNNRRHDPPRAEPDGERSMASSSDKELEVCVVDAHR